MKHTIITRSVAIEAIDSLNESIRDWQFYQSEQNLENNKPINDIIAFCQETVLALEGNTITIVEA